MLDLQQVHTIGHKDNVLNIKNKIFSNGGRVLNFVIRSDNFKDARNDIIKIINQLNWRGGFFRKDIGYKVIDK